MSWYQEWVRGSTEAEREEFHQHEQWRRSVEAADRAKYGPHGIHLAEPAEGTNDDDE